MTDIGFDLAALREGYAAGLDPVAVIDAVYDRIEAAGDPGIFISLSPRETARAAARALGAFDAKKPLWGAPFAVKDNIDVAGLPTTAACPTFARAPTEHAFAVRRLIDAGAIPIGKTNLDQFATGLVGVRTPYPVPKNAFDPAIVPGGSSSGSGVAVARGLVSFALGTDTAGSGRVPAALNNIVGLKPSLGAISVRGVVPACKSLDCVSVFAGCVDDAWRVFEALAAPDARDAFQRRVEIGAPGSPPPKWQCGVPRVEDLEFYGDTAAARAWDLALAVLADIGAELVPIDMRPFLKAAAFLYDGPWIAERHAALRGFLRTNADDALPVIRGIVGGAARFSASDAFEAMYALREIAAVAAQAMAAIDALAVPSVPRAPSVAELKRDPLGPNTQLGRWTNFVNLLDMAALAAPGPFRPDGLPAGATFIGPRGSDARLAGIGRLFHARAGVGMGARQTPTPRPVSFVDAREKIELVVVGAHMSGLPLNHELRGLGGVFSRAVQTRPCYRLYELPGGPPRRPGMIRRADGAAVACEVWSLAPEAFARFVAGIPAPLGIGTVLLSDGTAPKGFLAEPEGVADARDITEFGGWRAFAAAVSR